MSPLPVRFEMKASRVPSGDQSGRLSVAGLETSSRASPPAYGTVQISPPETKAISLWSGERLGSAKDGVAVGATFPMCEGENPIPIAASTATAGTLSDVEVMWNRCGGGKNRKDAPPR